MSIASAPEVEGVYELYIRFVNEPESPLPLTHQMWPIEVGDRLFCRTGATGKFTLPDTVGEDGDRIKVMVAAGTGLAPFLSMARSRVARDPGARLDDFAVLHGASYSTSLGYREELEGFAERNGLRYLPTISRPQAEPEWTGCAGRVEALLSPERIEDTERRLGLEPGEIVPERAGVLICGLQGTIANTIVHLLPRGYVPDERRLKRALGLDDAAASVFWEQYDAVPVIDTKDEALIAKLRSTVPEVEA
jgi:ferredoxin--NADP+ reductase